MLLSPLAYRILSAALVTLVDFRLVLDPLPINPNGYSRNTGYP